MSFELDDLELLDDILSGGAAEYSPVARKQKPVAFPKPGVGVAFTPATADIETKSFGSVKDRVSALQRRREDFFKGDGPAVSMPTSSHPPGVTNGSAAVNESSSAHLSATSHPQQRLPLSTKHQPPAPLANGESTNISRNGRSPSSEARLPNGSSGVAPIPSPRPPLSGRQTSQNSSSISTTPMTGVPATNGYSSSPRVPPQKETVIHGYVGFANIPNQVYRKAIKKGFEFTLMVVGQSGLGKSTFINSLFLTDVYNENDKIKHQDSVLDKTVQVEETSVRLEEQGVNLTLTLVDTPGFGDAVDNSECWEPVLQYIDRKNTEYFGEETKINRSVNIADKRVHVCLYFIAPTGHGLRALDIEFMKRMHDRVNIIPVIGKADTLTKEECMRFKKRILEEIAEHKIRIYDFPDSDEDEEIKGQRPLKERVPFAIVGSNVVAEMDGRKVRCRRYPWGVVEVENLEHNDFLALRNMLIRTHMIDLVEVTRGLHFENFRCRQLMSVRNDQSPNDLDPFTQMDDERKKHVLKVKEMESEMEAVFQQKVQEKQNMLNQMQQNLDQQIEQNKQQLEAKRQELAEKRSRLEAERDAYRQENPAFERYISSDSLPGKDKRKKHGLF